MPKLSSQTSMRAASETQQECLKSLKQMGHSKTPGNDETETMLLKSVV